MPEFEGISVYPEIRKAIKKECADRSCSYSELLAEELDFIED